MFLLSSIYVWKFWLISDYTIICSFISSSSSSSSFSFPFLGFCLCCFSSSVVVVVGYFCVYYGVVKHEFI